MEQSVTPPQRRNSALRFVAAGVAVLVVVIAVAVIALHDSVARGTLTSVARGFGYVVKMGSLHVNLGEATIGDIHVANAKGEPVLTARRIDVRYSLRDLLPGGTRLFGLKSIDVESPHITVIHHPNGTYNITVPASSPAKAKSSSAPLDVRVHVSDGSIDLIDRFVAAPHERREQIIELVADGTIAVSEPAAYRAGAVLLAAGKRYPIVGTGRFADARGFELQHFTAARLPIAGLANFALSTHAIVVQAGEIRDLDFKLGALANSAGVMQSHLGGSGRLVDGQLAAMAIAKPVRNARASFVIDDDSATVTNLDASINGLPLHARGALFHFADPQVKFALTARGDLSAVRALSKDIARLPIGGAIRLQGLAEGPASNPLIFARFASPSVSYGAYRLDGPRGFVAVSGQELDVLAADARYGRLGLAGRGALELQQHTPTIGYAEFRAPANSLPYVDNIVPGMPLAGTAVVRGSDGKLSARGYLGGAHDGARLDVPFALARSGSGTLGPIALQRSDGASIYARAALDRAANQTVAIIDARGLSLLAAPSVDLPGLTLPVLPAKLDGTVDATVTAIAHGTALASASGVVHVRGSWGDLQADASGAGARLAARGRLTTSFERLAAFTGDVGARGGIDVPFAVTNAGSATIVQVAGARFSNASIRGIALSGADATLGVGPNGTIDVYAAALQVADRTVTAQGRFGGGGQIHLTAGDFDLAKLRALGVPEANGRATLIADLGGTAAKPTGSVLAAVGDARYAGTSVGGSIGAAYDGSALYLDRAAVAYGGAYANVAGTVFGLDLHHIKPRYDLRAQLEDADIATLARTVKNPLRYPEGTLEAKLTVSGAGAAPAVAGVVQLPEGSINGLNFRAGSVGLHGTPAAVSAERGRLVVGSTTLRFSGQATRTQQSARLASARIDLADFNDYFDEAEVLAGVGNLALAVDAAPNSLHTSADLTLNGTEYRRFALGRATATVRTVGRTIRLQSGLAGENGQVRVAGSILVPGSDPLRDIARRAYVDLSAQIAGINLNSVLPAANIEAPVLGIVDASATVHGRYPALALSAKAALTKGVVGRLPIDRFTLAASAANGHGRLTELTLAAPGLTAAASGTFGLRPTDAFNLTAQLGSPNINALAAAATGKNIGATGVLQTQTRLTGTLAHPLLATSVDLTALTYQKVTLPKAHADIRATREAVDVRNGLIQLPRSGSIAFDGHAPLGSGAATPIFFDFVPHAIDVNAYSSLLPTGSVLNGIFDGNLGVRGTLASPQLNGRLTFSDGSYRSALLHGSLTAMQLQLDFAGTTMTIAKLHAHAAPGNIDGSGSIVLGDLRNPLPNLRANVNLTASNAELSVPTLYVGTIDGAIAATKRAGAPLMVGGNLTFSSARIPYTALVPSGGTTQGPAPVLPDVDFKLGVIVGRDVRIQSGPVDIGTTGVATLGGTLAKPTLDGQFTATDGTVSVYRTFVVQSGSTVTFNPSDGITPAVDATAVTQIPDPATDVLLKITGLSTNLHLAFSSQPEYSQQQILGLLVGAQALGAVSGVAQSGSSSSSGPSVSGIGEGLLNTQFTQKFLQPLSSKLGGALGLSDLNVNYNLNGAVSASARRSLGKNISFVYGEQIGGPTPRTSVGIDIGSAIAGAQLTFFQAAGSSRAFGGQSLTPYLQSGFLATSSPNYTLQAIEPPSGSGFVFSYQRRFWAK